jgi:hypothetical protein
MRLRDRIQTLFREEPFREGDMDENSVESGCICEGDLFPRACLLVTRRATAPGPGDHREEDKGANGET